MRHEKTTCDGCEQILKVIDKPLHLVVEMYGSGLYPSIHLHYCDYDCLRKWMQSDRGKEFESAQTAIRQRVAQFRASGAFAQLGIGLGEPDDSNQRKP